MSKQREEVCVAPPSKAKVLELRRQDSLYILRLHCEEGVVAQLVLVYGGDWSILFRAGIVESGLEVSWNSGYLVCLYDIPCRTDADYVPAVGGVCRLTSKPARILSMVAGIENRCDDFVQNKRHARPQGEKKGAMHCEGSNKERSTGAVRWEQGPVDANLGTYLRYIS
jgi:hypothetical protein